MPTNPVWTSAASRPGIEGPASLPPFGSPSAGPSSELMTA
jgi:hypothetical protein